MRACNKKAYFSEADAAQHMRFLRERGTYVRPYRCRRCNRWHFASVS